MINLLIDNIRRDMFIRRPTSSPDLSQNSQAIVSANLPLESLQCRSRLNLNVLSQHRLFSLSSSCSTASLECPQIAMVMQIVYGSEECL